MYFLRAAFLIFAVDLRSRNEFYEARVLTWDLSAKGIGCLNNFQSEILSHTTRLLISTFHSLHSCKCKVKILSRSSVGHMDGLFRSGCPGE